MCYVLAHNNPKLLEKIMRGTESKTEEMFFYLSLETFVPKDPPLRPIRVMVDKALAELNDRQFPLPAQKQYVLRPV